MCLWVDLSNAKEQDSSLLKHQLKRRLDSDSLSRESMGEDGVPPMTGMREFKSGESGESDVDNSDERHATDRLVANVHATWTRLCKERKVDRYFVVIDSGSTR